MTLQTQYSARDVVKNFKKIDNLQYSTILQANYFVVSLLRVSGVLLLL